MPVVVLDDPEQAPPLGEALLAGGIDVVEITLRTDAGLEAIRRLAKMPGMHVGAGSVLATQQVDQVVEPAPGSSSAPVCRSTWCSGAVRWACPHCPGWPRPAT